MLSHDCNWGWAGLPTLIDLVPQAQGVDERSTNGVTVTCRPSREYYAVQPQYHPLRLFRTIFHKRRRCRRIARLLGPFRGSDADSEPWLLDHQLLMISGIHTANTCLIFVATHQHVSTL